MQSKQAYEIHGSLEGRETTATPDTGAGLNTIDTSFALAHGYVLKTDKKHRAKIKTLNQGTFVSDGAVELKWTFEGEPETEYNVLFQAVSNSPHKILLGMPFLRETGTMGSNNHRITTHEVLHDRYVSTRSVCFQSTADSVLPHAKGKLGGKNELMLADSGSEVNVMSLAYAHTNAYHVDRSPDEQETLRFSDGSERRTIGRARARWKFAHDNISYVVEFGVLENSHFDLVLGQDILFDTEAFKNHAEAIVYLSKGLNDVSLSDGMSDDPNDACNIIIRFVCAVRLIPSLFIKREKPKNSPEGGQDNARDKRDAELERRAEAGKLIVSMPDELAKTHAIEAEEQRCRAWQQHQQQKQQSASTSSAGEAGPMNAGISVTPSDVSSSTQ